MRSRIPFPELDDEPDVPGDLRPEVVVARATAPVTGADGWSLLDDGFVYVHTSPSGLRARLEVRGDASGGALTVSGPDELPAEVVRLLALGPGLAAWGVRAGLAVMHGNTVRIAGADVLLTGPGGVGKSTLTAVLLARGAQLVADDIALLEPGEPPSVRPGFGRLKLWEDALAHVGRDPEGLPRVHPEHTKRGLAVPCVQEARPLRAVLVLGRGELVVRPCTGGEAVRALLPQARVPELLHGPAEVTWLAACGALARSTAVLEVGIPGPLDALESVAATIEAAVGSRG